MGFFFLAWENVRPFIPSLQFLFVCLFLEVEISSHTLIPLFMPGSVHSGSASVGSKPVSDAWIVLCDSAYSLITWDRVTGGGPAGLNELKRTRSSSEERWRSITFQFPGGDHWLPCATREDRNAKKYLAERCCGVICSSVWGVTDLCNMPNISVSRGYFSVRRCLTELCCDVPCSSLRMRGWRRGVGEGVTD